MKKLPQSALKHSLGMAVALACASALLTGCHDKRNDASQTEAPAAVSAPANPDAQALQRRNDLLDSVSGVWKPTDDGGRDLLTIYLSGSPAQAAEGDKALSVALGDVDPDNGTVVMKVYSHGKEELRTLARIEAEDGGPSSLQMTGGDGQQRLYNFLRKVSNDDLNRITRLSAAVAAPASDVQPAAPANRGVVDMYLGAIDMNLRSCPGSTCASMMIVPKDSTVKVDTSTIREVSETSGVNTPWVRVTYEGGFCMPSEQSSQNGCEPSGVTNSPMTGWMNYTRLLDAPRVQ